VDKNTIHKILSNNLFTFVLSFSQFFETVHSFISNRWLVQRGKHSQWIDQRWDLHSIATITFKFQNSFTNFHQKLVIIVHLLDYLNYVGNELFFDSIVTFIMEQIPRTKPITGILVAALSLREGLSLLSY